MSLQNRIKIKPIGFVKTDVKDEDIWLHEQNSEIIVDERYMEGLEGIIEYSHIFVIFWMHKVPLEKQKKLKVHPKGHVEVPKHGIFAVRTYVRPNPIGLTVVKLLDVKDNKLTVAGLDAMNNTPVLDIKPYDYDDVIQKIKVPKWWLTLKDLEE